MRAFAANKEAVCARRPLTLSGPSVRLSGHRSVGGRPGAAAAMTV